MSITDVLLLPRPLAVWIGALSREKATKEANEQGGGKEGGK